MSVKFKNKEARDDEDIEIRLMNWERCKISFTSENLLRADKRLPGKIIRATASSTHVAS
jgi:hypothetical protein